MLAAIRRWWLEYRVRRIWREAARYADQHPHDPDAVGRFLSNVGCRIASGTLPPGTLAKLGLDNLGQRIEDRLAEMLEA